MGGVIPREYISSVRKGIEESMEAGVLAGYPMVDVKAALVDGSYHEVDSSELAFKIAGSMALREGAQKARPVLLEPVMKVEAVVPEEYVGDVVGDFSGRRGDIGSMDARNGAITAITANVPLSEMFGYATDIRSMTSGRGTFTMEFLSYAPVPQSVAERILKGRV